MAYETDSATDAIDLLQKLSTFAQTSGWTEDASDYSTDHFLALHKDGIFVQFKYNIAGTGQIGIYQSLSYDAQLPGFNGNDSGNGDVVGTVDSGRRINNITLGPFTAYHFFAGDTYIHVALEFQSGLYRHFSFGMLSKIGDWTGGEYAAGHLWQPGFGDSILDSRHTIMMDALQNQDVTVCPTVHAEGLPDEDVSSKWLIVSGGFNDPGIDRATNPRGQAVGGLRGGFLQEAHGWLQVNPNNGFVPLFPIAVYYRHRATSPEQWRLLGHMPDVRGCNIAQIVPGDELTIGGDTWKFFPWVRKAVITVGQDSSGHMGLAYRKTV